MQMTALQFGQHAMGLQHILQSPLATSPRQILDAVHHFQGDLTAANVPSPHLASIQIYLERIPWGDDVCHQVCDGLRTLLQLKGLGPKHNESAEALFARFHRIREGENHTYEDPQTIRVGTMSRVDRVRHKPSNRIFVRKTFEREPIFGLADSGFFNEARFTQRMGSRSAVQVLDYGATPDAKPFLVFENMAGDLRSLFDPQKPRDVHQEAVKLTSLILHAHFHGIIHRDIKPSNILVDEEGNYRLADFGLALYHNELDCLPSFSYFHGTPAYMPPEARKELRSFVPNFGMDVYSMGMTLLETVTGRFLPERFSGKDVSKLLGIRDEGWMRFFRRVLEADGNSQWQLERLAAIVNKAMSPYPNERYRHGGEMFKDAYETLKPSVMSIIPMVEAIRESMRTNGSDQADTVVDRPRRDEG